MFQDDDGRRYVVVRNEAGDHSIWPGDRPAPAGWLSLDMAGAKADCLDYIRRNWTCEREP